MILWYSTPSVLHILEKSNCYIHRASLFESFAEDFGNDAVMEDSVRSLRSLLGLRDPLEMLSLNKIVVKCEGSNLLVLVAGVVPVIPAAVGDHVIKIGEGEDDPGVLAHGPAHVEWARTRHPAAHESEPGLLVRPFPILRRYGPEPRRY
ncbi:unnamed protein product [Camellia sinensis]